jgi:hypothetical protein
LRKGIKTSAVSGMMTNQSMVGAARKSATSLRFSAILARVVRLEQQFTDPRAYSWPQRRA